MIKVVTTAKGNKMRVVIGSPDEYLSESDKEMDRRANAAIEAAIKKAIICKNPIAKYDAERKKAYLEYPGGRREYGE